MSYFEILLEEPSSFHVYTHSGEHNGEIVFRVVQDWFSGKFDKTSLSTNLGSDLERQS